MQSWLGPALIAAFVSGVFTVAGWFASYVLGRRQDGRRRRERIIDVQTALRAEIRSFHARSQSLDIAEHGKQMGRWILDSSDENTPFVPQEPEFLIYRAIAPEIHILPQHVIDAIVLFYTQASTLALFAADLRADQYKSLAPTRKNAMYQDYLAIMEYAFRLAQQAIEALDDSLKGKEAQ